MGRPVFGEGLIKVGKNENPMLALGAGPEGKRCKTCIYLIGVRHSRIYWKCRKRGVSASTKTDHRLRWPACVYYQEATTGGNNCGDE